jgi:SAM-dependent methyltransferase
LPIAERVRGVVGVDPEPDMLRRARQAADDANVTNVTWMLGADTDLPAVGRVVGDSSIGAVTVGQALHWMQHDQLFRSAASLVRADGGVAVVTNGAPLWLQDSDWSRALRDWLERWLDEKLTFACGTDEPSQRLYHQSMTQAGFDVSSTSVDYEVELTLDQIVGGVLSALPVHLLPAPDARPGFAQQISAALGPHRCFSEHVHVAILAGRLS